MTPAQVAWTYTGISTALGLAVFQVATGTLVYYFTTPLLPIGIIGGTVIWITIFALRRKMSAAKAERRSAAILALLSIVFMNAWSVTTVNPELTGFVYATGLAVVFGAIPAIGAIAISSMMRRRRRIH